MFQEGDLVRIKDWKEWDKDFRSPLRFAYSGDIGTVTEVIPQRGTTCYRLDTQTLKRPITIMTWREDLLEPAFIPGRRVRIRSWESMAEEFGETEGGNLSTPRFLFTGEMGPLCGLYATIDRVFGTTLTLKDWSDKEVHDRTHSGIVGDWFYTKEMVELVPSMSVMLDFKKPVFPKKAEEVVRSLKKKEIRFFGKNHGWFLPDIPDVYWISSSVTLKQDFTIDISTKVDWDLVKDFLLNENRIRMGKNIFRFRAKNS